MEKARLAAAMTQITEQNEDSIRRAWCALGLPAGGKLWFSTILVHLTNVSDCSEIPGLTDFMSWLQKAAQKKKIAFLYSSRTESRLLLHLYRSAELTRKYVAWFTLQLQKFLMNRFQFFIAAGMPVRGLLQVGLSYKSAVETLGSSFYNDLNSILLWTEHRISSAPIDMSSSVTAFRSAITSGAYTEAANVEQQFYESILLQRQAPADMVKNVYYQFISIMELAASKSCIAFSASQQEERSP